MNLKPELTFSRAVRAIGRWWWFVLLCGLVFLAAAYLLAGRSVTARYHAKARVHVVNTVVSFNPRGEPIPATVVPRTTSEVSPEDFRVDSVARTTLEQLGNRTLRPDQMLAQLMVTPLSPTDVELSYNAASEERAKVVLSTYVTEYVQRKRAQQEGALTDAIESLTTTAKSINKTLNSIPAPISGATESTAAAYEVQRLEIVTAISRLKLASDLLSKQIAPVGQVRASSFNTGLPPLLASLGGLIAGLIAGALLTLLIVRFDPRLRRATDLSVPDVLVVDIGSKHRPEAIQRLRSQLEINGIGRELSAVAVTSATSAETRTGIALELAQAFAAAGTPTVLVSADVGGWDERSKLSPLAEPGVAGFLDGTVTSLESVAVTENLEWIPRGKSNAETEFMLTSDKIERLLAEARALGRVVIVDAPPVDDPSGLLLASSTELTLLVVQRARTSWARLEAGLEQLQRSAGAYVQICFDQAVSRPRAGRLSRRSVFARRRLTLPTPTRS